MGLPTTAYFANNPTTHSCIDLGRRLFADTAISADGKISCAKCHQPTKAFSDGLPVAEGEAGQRGTRNVPSLWNVALQPSLFWDGRATSLEEQALKPLFNPLEIGIANEQSLLDILNKDTSYRTAFTNAFPESHGRASTNEVAMALACYERTLIAADSPFDRYQFGGDKNALSLSAKRGLALFSGQAGCATCHQISAQNATFMDGKFHRRGIGLARVQHNLSANASRVAIATAVELDRLIVSSDEIAELGRFVVTRDPADIGRFKTPSLRNVALTGPYMHDGSIAGLREAVVSEAYYGTAEGAAPIQLSARQVTDLVEFLNSLTSPVASSAVSLAESRGAVVPPVPVKDIMLRDSRE